MARRFRGPIAVAVVTMASGGAVDREVAAGPPDSDAPLAFVWRGRRYGVRRVLDRWSEAGSWWRQLAEGIPLTVTSDSDVWRVEASRGVATPNSVGTGVYDLVYEQSKDQWHLARVWD